MGSEDEEKERRFHLWLCDEANDTLHQTKKGMWKIEFDRAKRYGRVDPTAIKAHEAIAAIDKVSEKITQLIEMLHRQNPTQRR